MNTRKLSGQHDKIMGVPYNGLASHSEGAVILVLSSSCLRNGCVSVHTEEQYGSYNPWIGMDLIL